MYIGKIKRINSILVRRPHQVRTKQISKAGDNSGVWVEHRTKNSFHQGGAANFLMLKNRVSPANARIFRQLCYIFKEGNAHSHHF